MFPAWMSERELPPARGANGSTGTGHEPDYLLPAVESAVAGKRLLQIVYVDVEIDRSDGPSVARSGRLQIVLGFIERTAILGRVPVSLQLHILDVERAVFVEVVPHAAEVNERVDRKRRHAVARL